MRSLDRRTVLITGGTRGLGKAIAFEFARAGARVVVTHRWGTVSADDFAAEVAAERLPPITVRESDASDSDAINALVTELARDFDGIDVLVSNLAFAKPVENLADLKRSSFELSLRYTA